MTNNAELKPLGMDAKRWADEFNKVLVSKGEQPYDPGFLIGWFANAIMAGADVTQWKFEKREAELLHVIRQMEKAGNHLAEMASAYPVPVAAEQRIAAWEVALSLAREVKG